ncbi:MAG: transcriptional activator RfaH [Rhodospirillaceae bacterium]|nr:transcriptional activator RfaH [Rhodospirillaceae bacterium]|tara:strand:- start:53 stop:550 length:498 start_codon:yes stop_codon:yes gene_type:complete
MKWWYVVQTRPQAEVRAAQHLGNQGFDAWLPQFRKTVRHARKSQSVLRPLFPRYLFVRVDLDAEQWRSILGTVGVISLVGGDPPTPMADEVVEVLRQRCDEEGLVRVDPALGLTAGQSVRIAEGPLADLEGVFLEVDDQARVAILLSLMGRTVRVQVDARNVEAI